MRILDVRSKHGTSYYDASTDNKLYKLALQILRSRHGKGLYSAGTPPKEPPATREMVQNWPQGAMRTAAEEAWKQYDRAQSDYKWRQDFEREVDEALRNKAGKDAWNLLVSREDHEYEELALIDVLTEFTSD